jgi:hypothetical protein
MRIVLATFVLAALSGCALRMQSSVEAFAAGDAIRPSDRVMVLPAVEPGRETLEHRAWVDLTEAQLRRRGVAVTRSAAEATLFAGIGLGMDTGRDVTSSFAIPQWGVTGYSGASTSGTVSRVGNMATVNATTTYFPQYGVTGYQTGTRTNRVFRRVGTLTFLRPAADAPPQTVFQSRVASEGSCGMLSALAPNLVGALFTTFPAGGTRRLTADINDDC